MKNGVGLLPFSLSSAMSHSSPRHQSAPLQQTDGQTIWYRCWPITVPEGTPYISLFIFFVFAFRPLVISLWRNAFYANPLHTFTIRTLTLTPDYYVTRHSRQIRMIPNNMRQDEKPAYLFVQSGSVWYWNSHYSCCNVHTPVDVTDLPPDNPS